MDNDDYILGYQDGRGDLESDPNILIDNTGIQWDMSGQDRVGVPRGTPVTVKDWHDSINDAFKTYHDDFSSFDKNRPV